ncbi:integral membrane protein [Colletotrichum caudatum]|nr:integral membrane protein [Colletotrichum caudatum]
MTTVAGCLCPSIPLQSGLSTCVQLSCRLEDQELRADGQEGTAKLETNLCAAYPKESRSREVMTIAIVLPAMAFPIVGLRCLSRWRSAGRLWWDDWMAVVSAILLGGLAGIEIASAGLGFGSHYWNVDLANGRKIIRLFYAIEMLYILIQVFAKISILLFLSRIFPARWFQLTVRSLIVVLLLHALAFVLVTAFQCDPISFFWDTDNSERKCLNIGAIRYSGAGVSLAEELAILFLPLPELAKLRIDMRHKMALSFIFSLGIFSCITTMIRIKYMAIFSSTFDMTWDNVDIVIWSIIKEFCAITCASFLALRPLLQESPDLFSSSEETPKVTSTARSRRSMAPHAGKDQSREVPETSMTDDNLPPTPIDIADQMAALADGKRPVVFTKHQGKIVRCESELQDVESGMKWQKHSAW